VQYLHCDAKKLQHVIFAITLSNLSSLYSNSCIGINLEQNDIKITSLLWRVSLYCLVKYNYTMSWPTSILSRHYYRLEYSNEKLHKAWKCTEQQIKQLKRSAMVNIFRMLHQPVTKWSLINRLIIDRLLWMLDQPSFRHRLNSSISRTEF